MSEHTIEELAKAERKAYFKEWRANNKDRVKAHNATYWKKRVIQKMENAERDNDNH